MQQQHSSAAQAQAPTRCHMCLTPSSTRSSEIPRERSTSATCVVCAGKAGESLSRVCHTASFLGTRKRAMSVRCCLPTGWDCVRSVPYHSTMQGGNIAGGMMNRHPRCVCSAVARQGQHSSTLQRCTMSGPHPTHQPLLLVLLPGPVLGPLLAARRVGLNLGPAPVAASACASGVQSSEERAGPCLRPSSAQQQQEGEGRHQARQRASSSAAKSAGCIRTASPDLW